MTHDRQFKNDCIDRIYHVIRKFNLGLRLVAYTETSAHGKFDLYTYGRLSEIKRLEDEFQNVLGEKTTVEASNGYVNIIVSKPRADVLPLSDILNSPFYQTCPARLKIPLGEAIDGGYVIGDLDEWVHVLVAGETGGGKSVLLHTMIASIIHGYSPDEMRFVLIDLKHVEFTFYEDIAYLQLPVIYDANTALTGLKWLTDEMNRRYKLFKQHRVRDISAYNDRVGPLHRIVVIIDEYANLILSNKDAEKELIKIAQMARASGIHLILSTQKPSKDVVTPLIKANIPTRIALSVSSHYDSMTILDQTGAERLNGRGDMILKDSTGTYRIQGAYISEREIEELARQYVVEREYDYNEEMAEEYLLEGPAQEIIDPLYLKAAKICVENNQCNHWFLKRQLRIGDRKGFEVLEWLQNEGIVGKEKEGRDYPILMTTEELEGKYGL